MAFEKTLAAAKADAFAVVAEGDEITEGGFLVSEEGLTGIEAQLAAGAAAQADLATANETIAANATTIENLNAEVNSLRQAQADNNSEEQQEQTEQATAQADRIAELENQVTSLTTERDALSVDAEKWRKSASGTGSTVIAEATAESTTGKKKHAWLVDDGSEAYLNRRRGN